MSPNKTFRTLSATLVALASLATAADAAFTLDFSDDIGKVIVTFSGSLDTTGFSSTFAPVEMGSEFLSGTGNGDWTWINSGATVGSGNTNMAAIFVDSALPVVDISNNGLNFSTSNHLGDALYLWAYNDGSEGGFATDASYVSGDLLSGSFELLGATVSGLGIIETTWFTTTNGDKMNVTVNGVPEPSAALLGGMAALGLTIRRRRR